MCEECGYTFEDKKKGGTYYCPQCDKETSFYSFTFGCGGKPSELYKEVNKSS